MTVPEAVQDQGPVALVSGEDFWPGPQLLVFYLMKGNRKLSGASFIKA